MRVYIYARVEESLYNRLFIGRYKSVAYQAVSKTLSKDCEDKHFKNAGNLLAHLIKQNTYPHSLLALVNMIYKWF